MCRTERFSDTHPTVEQLLVGCAVGAWGRRGDHRALEACARGGLMPNAVTAPRNAATAIAHQPCWYAARTSWEAVPAPRITTNTETPRLIPIWRLMLTTALPVATRAGGRSAVAAESRRQRQSDSGARDQPAGQQCYGVVRCRADAEQQHHVAEPEQEAAGCGNHPGGTRCATRWLNAARIGTINGPGATPNPVCSAL